MANNLITYRGRVVVRKGESIDFARTSGGLYILGPFWVVEDHQQKVGRVRKQPKLSHLLELEENFGKGDDDYITVASSWHKITVMGDKAEALAQNGDFGKSALIEVEASYEEDPVPWVDRQNVTRAGRPESIGDKVGSIKIKFPPFDDQKTGPIWDGISDVPEPRRGGGGAAREVREDEGF